ncbi:MAG: hypothetical protein JW963_03980 [Anaerolineales bacterium]|nr:hypothetical protein [Anaerolineales bacterium]
MPGPTQDLINRCYAVLARCDQFRSLQSLQAIFVSEELSPFRDRLRNANNLGELIRLNVEYLLYQTTTDGHHIFTIFLQALRPSSEKDALYSDLDNLCSEFEQSLGQVNRVNVPYVVAAMNQAEAADLQSGKVFQDSTIAPIEYDRFNALIPDLPKGWIEDYRERRDEWKLHADHQSVIGEVLRDMFADINHCLRQPQNLPVISSESFSERFFSPERQKETWENLRQSGGLLIVDAISLFYPPIRQALVRSRLDAGDQMAVLVLSPLDFHAAPINGQVKHLVLDEMPMTFARFAEHLDHRYEMGIGDLCGIQRWLFTLFTKPEDMVEIIQQRKKALRLEQFRNQAPPPTGKMAETIFRESEVEQ